jgi:hypothetical protein
VLAFTRGPRRAPAPVPVRAFVFAVGGRAWVACAGGQADHASLTDDAGKRLVASLSDGAEVTILGWRPGWTGTARYRVRVTATAVEGWLAGANLRRTEVAPPLPPAAPPSPPPPPSVQELEAAGRRFGQR